MKLKPLVAFLTYLGLAVIMTWPLVANITTQIMGAGGDAPIFLWDAWWVKKVLFEGENLFSTGYIFYPQVVSLVFHTLTLVNSSVIAVLSALADMVLVFNLYFLLSVAFSGLSMFLLVRHITKSSWPAFISGIIFAFAPYATAHWLGHQNLVTLWFIPLFVLFLIRTVEETKWRWPLLAGLVAGLACLNDFYNFVFLFIFSVLAALWFLIAHRKQINRGLISRIAASGLVWLAVWSIWWIPAISSALAGQHGPVMTLEQITAFYSADPLRYLTPSFLNPILGGLASLVPGRFSGGVEGTIYLGAVPLIIVVIFLFYKFKNKVYGAIFPSVWFWISTIIVFGLLSLGPYLKIAERIIHIPLPYLWIYNISEYWANFRVPARFSLMVIFALAILVGVALSYLWPKLKSLRAQRVLILTVASLIILEFIPAPYPTMDLSTPPVYQVIAQDSKSDSLLDIPWGINSGYWDAGSFQSRFMYWATRHGKKVAIGSLARVPYEVFEFYPETKPPFMVPLTDPWQPDLVLLHKNYFAQDNIQSYSDLIAANGYVKAYEDTTHVLYRSGSSVE